MSVVEIQRGASPLILAFPHTGTEMPAEIWQRLNPNGQILADTDWHIDRLFENLIPTASTVRATFHRYVIDANRDPSGESLYPGQNTTGLIPETDFDAAPIWREGESPSRDDIKLRLAEYHAPYHVALLAEIERIKSLHGVVVLYDCHSIRSRIPNLFPGKLPDFNIGTFDGVSCDRSIEQAVMIAVSSAIGFDSVLNGRFKGGWTTRHYGRPSDNVHAIQMELAQSAYLKAEKTPFEYDQPKSDRLRGHLRTVLQQIELAALNHRG